MNVVKEEKRNRRNEGRYIRLGESKEPRLWKRRDQSNNSSVATTTTVTFLFLWLHNSHTFSRLPCLTSNPHVKSRRCGSSGSLLYRSTVLYAQSEVGDKHRLRCSSYAGCQTNLAEKRLELFFLACTCIALLYSNRI
jgi:hypothetical protein